MADGERLAGLDAYLRALDAIEAGGSPGAGFERIAAAVREHSLPVALLRDLIDAFRQDVVKKRYADFAELLDYSRRSANPVGRLVLHLFGRTDAASLAQSDNICSALQFINFWQDVAIDWRKDRVYIPREDLEKFAVPETDIATGAVHQRWTELMAFECDRARALLRRSGHLRRCRWARRSTRRRSDRSRSRVRHHRPNRRRRCRRAWDRCPARLPRRHAGRRRLDRPRCTRRRRSHRSRRNRSTTRSRRRRCPRCRAGAWAR